MTPECVCGRPLKGDAICELCSTTQALQQFEQSVHVISITDPFTGHLGRGGKYTRNNLDGSADE